MFKKVWGDLGEVLGELLGEGFGEGFYPTPAGCAIGLQDTNQGSCIFNFESTPNRGFDSSMANGIEDVINVPVGHGPIYFPVVEVEIENGHIDNFKLTLTAPDGTEVVLHDQVGGNDRGLWFVYDDFGNSEYAP
mgnify:CR=1 FL=1